MSSTIIFFLFIPLLSLILLSINIIFAPHNPYIEKNNTFECGFTSFLGQNRIQFSISFFIFALLFLLFDLEILLVYPYLVSAYLNETYGLLILMVFLGVLTIGFIFELGKKALTIDSKQTVLSNYNLIKKSLSTIPYTTISINSRLVKSFFIRGSVLVNKNVKKIKNLHVKSVNFHTNLSLYANYYKDYNLSKARNYDTMVGCNPYKKANHTGLCSTNNKFLLSIPKLPNMLLPMIYDQKRSFSTTNSLNGLGIIEEINKINSRKDTLTSHILGKHDQNYYYTEHFRIKKYNSSLNPNVKGVQDARWLKSIEGFFRDKVNAIEDVDTDHADKLFILSSNNIIDNKLPTIRNNMAPVYYRFDKGPTYYQFDRGPTYSPIKVKHLDYVRDLLDRPLNSKPSGWKPNCSTENNLDDDTLGTLKLCPPYMDNFIFPKGQGFYEESNDETNKKSIVEHSDSDSESTSKWTRSESLVMRKPVLINRELGGDTISKPLEPVEMPFVCKEIPTDFRKKPGSSDKKHINDDVNPTESISMRLDRNDTMLLSNSNSDLSSELVSTSALCLFVSFGEVSPCLRFMFLLMSIIKTNYGVGFFPMLAYKLKYTLIVSANETIKIIRSAIVFIVKNLNSSPNPTGVNCNKTNNAYSSDIFDHFYYQLHKNNLIMHSSMFSSLFNTKFLFTKTFLHSYIYTLKDKFNYKWVISMVLAILFTYIFRNILIYRLNSWGIDLTSITGISISISSISVFFRSILHLIECAISYEIGKMPLGPNDITDVSLPKNTINENTVLKKDGADTVMEDEPNCESSITEASSIPNANKKFSLQNLPCDIRQEIAEHAGADLKGMLKLTDDGASTQRNLEGGISSFLGGYEKIEGRPVPVYRPETSVWGIKFIHGEMQKDYEDLIAFRRKLNYMVETRKILVPEKDFHPNYVQKCEKRADELIKRFHDIAKDAVWENEAMQKAINPSTVPTIGDRYKKEISENTKVFADRPK